MLFLSEKSEERERLIALTIIFIYGEKLMRHATTTKKRFGVIGQSRFFVSTKGKNR